jgi:glycosyltransferase involved in cell wall biosynthesis
MSTKVSILIPTYNRPHYFEEALKSALDQTYPNIEIIICDNSESDSIEKVVNRYRSEENPSRIRYVRNDHNMGFVANLQKCFELSTGEYINYLMSDDLLHPQKIEKMMFYFLYHSDVTLVTSHRQVINETGLLIPVPPAGPFMRLYEQDTILDGIEFGNLVLNHWCNFIGEPTTVLFRKGDLDEPFGVFTGRQAENNVDVGSWLILLAKGKGVYIAETLSYYRSHSEQLTHHADANMKGLMDWIYHQHDAPSKGFASGG